MSEGLYCVVAGSVRASVMRRLPSAILGRNSCFWASLPAARIVQPPRMTVEK